MRQRHAAAEPPITDEQLRLAYRHLARPGWPPTLEATLAHPIRGKCLRSLALCLRRGGHLTRPHYQPPTPPGAPPVPPTPEAPRAVPRQRHYLGADRKRLAANDLED